jgi:intracellular multiplication protein IcmE
MIGVGGIALLGLIGAVLVGGHQAQPFSKDARMSAIDALPGGLHSTPEQNALAQKADTAHARQALDAGNSYTPPLAPSAPVTLASSAVGQPSPPATPPAPHFVPHPVPSPIVQVAQPVFPPEIMVTPTAAASAPNSNPPASVAANPQAVADYTKQIGDLFSQWNGRAPETDVVLPPPAPSNGSLLISVEN